MENNQDSYLLSMEIIGIDASEDLGLSAVIKLPVGIAPHLINKKISQGKMKVKNFRLKRSVDV